MRSGESEKTALPRARRPSAERYPAPLSMGPSRLSCGTTRPGLATRQEAPPVATLNFARETVQAHDLPPTRVRLSDEARQMEQVYWYCLAYAAKLHGVLVHAACLMSSSVQSALAL